MQIWGDNTVNEENKRVAPLTNWMKETKTQQERLKKMGHLSHAPATILVHKMNLYFAS